MNLFVASKNPGKIKEIRELVGDFGLHIYSPENFNIVEDCEETGLSFEDNALIKARFYANFLPPEKEFLVLADDSGIHVNALANELGVQTRRWGAGAQATDEEWLRVFLERMQPEEDRCARFVCAIALIHAGKEHVFIGENEGQLLQAPQTALDPGIPLSSIFLPHGCEKVYSALSVDEKNKISHRGRALQQFLNYLNYGA